MIIQPGIQVSGGVRFEAITQPVSAGLVMNLDASTLSASPTTWVDSVSNLSFTLFGSPTYSTSNGGVLQFAPASSQYAQSSNQGFGSLSRWTAETWHYYTGTNSSGLPSILTEVYPGSTNKINFSLGSDTTTGLQSGFYDGAWRATTAYSLTASNWYQIVGTYDGTTVKLYVNGALALSTNYTGTSSTSQGGIRLMRRWDNAEYWGGYLGIVRMYNTDIGLSGVQQNFNANRARFGL
jgi:hypothetical protein